jgi:RNA polymerase sigma-70 factor (ECF subfamily)
MSGLNKKEMTPTDSELIELSKAGNMTAFEQLIFRYDNDVLSIAARFTQSSDDAKDIYQETFIRVFKGLPKFQQKSEFATWLFRITTNVCLTHKEKKKKSTHVSLDEEGDDESSAEYAISSESADSLAHREEISHTIDNVLQTLSPQQRLVFTLRHYQDYKLKDIAVMMNCAEGTVKKYLFEATQKMRNQLKHLYE